MKHLLTLFFVAGIVTLLACGPNAKERAEIVKQDSIAKQDSIKKIEENNHKRFLGKWIDSKGAKLIITEAGETAYTIKAIGPRDSFGIAWGDTYTATYQDGNLVEMGMVICSYSNGKIISNGDEYKKVK